jgi:hypothetical protein
MNSQDNNGYLPTTYLLFTVSHDKKKSCGTFSHAMQEQNKLGGTLWFYFSGEATLLVRPPWRRTPSKTSGYQFPTSSQPLSISGRNDEQTCFASIAFRLGWIHLLTEPRLKMKDCDRGSLSMMSQCNRRWNIQIFPDFSFLTEAEYVQFH